MKILNPSEIKKIQNLIKVLEVIDKDLPWQETENRLEILGLGQTLQAIRNSKAALQCLLRVAACHGGCENTRKALGLNR